MAKNRKVEPKDENRDPISGAPGAHPAGVAAGAAAGGAAGGAIGAAAGPVGAAVGAAVGAVAGGLAGKGVAEAIDPTAEEAYWRDNYRTRPYYEENLGYDQLAPAYRYGWESHSQFKGRRFDEVESDLERGWDRAKANSSLQWTKAKLATRDAWDRIERGRRAA
jgi:hypothetical protein